MPVVSCKKLHSFHKPIQKTCQTESIINLEADFRSASMSDISGPMSEEMTFSMKRQTADSSNQILAVLLPIVVVLVVILIIAGILVYKCEYRDMCTIFFCGLMK